MITARNRPGLALGLFFLLSLGACERLSPPPAAPQVAKPAATATYAGELAKLDAALAHGKSIAAKQEGSVVPLEMTSLYLERARLSGNYADYQHAQALLDTLPKGSAAHCLATAKLHYTLHRLKQATAILDACPPGVDAAELAALRGDLAMYSGRYREAETTYRNLVNHYGQTPHYVRLALLKNRMGSPGEAAALLEAAEKRYHGGSAVMQAWLKLQRGLIALDRGRLDEAVALYRLGTDALGGWWLLDEHIAEAQLLAGKVAEAQKLYEDIVQRTGAPEFMDALAALQHHNGNHADAAVLKQDARALYEQRLAQFPEAAAGHALDHYLVDAGDAKLALQLAQQNFATRPFGEAAIALAKAWMRSGQPGKAVALIETQLVNGWDTAEAHWILGEARRQLGQVKPAHDAKAEALRRNPLSETMYAFVP